MHPAPPGDPNPHRRDDPRPWAAHTAPGQIPPQYPAGPPHQPPPAWSHPAHGGPFPPPAGWPAPPPPRRRGNTLPILLSVGFVVVLLIGCVGLMVVKPWYDRQQLEGFYQDELSFGMPGFHARTPVIEDHPFRLVQVWVSDRDQWRDPKQDLPERAPKSLYRWARDHGSTAPQEDFAECFSRHCNIAWDYREHELSLIMTPERVGDVPSWTMSLTVQPH